MKNSIRLYPHISGIVAIIIFIGCGGPPQNNPLLVDAETRYFRASTDSQTVVNAPVALKEAEENLEMSKEIWENRGDKKLIEHYAYLALQKTAIAEETAKMNAAQEEIEQAESKRKEVLLLARKAEAEAAEQRAQEAIAQAQREKAAAQQAREEAVAARDRAESMAERINELEAKQTERGLVLTLSDVLFDFNSAELNPGSDKVIDELSSFLDEYPERTILIEGYTDSIGSADYNMKLSLQRADAVRAALVENGVLQNRVGTRAFGEEYPVATNMNEAGRQQNRRVEIVVSDEEGTISQRSGR